jgi:hypothetical protein
MIKVAVAYDDGIDFFPAEFLYPISYESSVGF